MPISVRLCAGACFLALTLPAHAQLLAANIETVIVTGVRAESDLPNRIENVEATDAQVTINAVDTEDMLKYVPSILVRKRHYGDTQDPLATRTNGVGASARSLLFVDGILISSPIGNNNTYASPHFGIAQPQDIANFQVLYGPFAAEYGGGSIGAVLNITTRMPDHFTLYADALDAVQPFRQYGTHDTYNTWQVSGGVGDRDGAFSWRLSANHLSGVGQPLAFVTLTRTGSPTAAGTPTMGAFDDFNRANAAIAVVGAGGIEAQTQDTDTLKFAYDFTNGWQATYTASVFHQTDDARAQTYLRDGGGNPVYAGNGFNIDGYSYNIGAAGFSNNVYDWNQTHLAQAVTLKSGSDGAFAWEFVGSDYNYLDDNQRVPTTALPGALAGGAGTINRLNGTGWYTLDAKGVWKGWADHEFSFGAHRDAETFSQIKYTTPVWQDGDPAAVSANARGRTAQDALWIQDIWHFAPDFKAIIGGRLEDWRAYDGLNTSASPALNTTQPKLSSSTFSPKASLAWTPLEAWTFSASWGVATRMPTVTELYQAITTGTNLTVPNPDLKPEHANSHELSAEYQTGDTRLRLSLFREDIGNALLSQSAPLVTGSTTLYSYVQNVDRTRAQGVELVADRKDVLSGLDLSGSLTYVNGRTVKDTAFPAAVNKYIPQLPRFRASALATYHATDALALTLAARYSDRSYGTIDNSDPNSHTFQGFDGFLVMDVRAHYQVDENWSAALGIDNLNSEKYFLYHPFPQRTFVMEVRYAQ